MGKGYDASTVRFRHTLVLAALALASAPLATAGQLSGGAQPPSTVQPPGDDPSPGDLVVVTASRREEQLINAPATMTVITEEAIAAAPSPSFVELMRVVPGVNVAQMSARDVNITSRAPTGSQNSDARR